MGLGGGASVREEEMIDLQGGGGYDELTSRTSCNKSIREEEKQDKRAALGAFPLLLDLADLSSILLFSQPCNLLYLLLSWLQDSQVQCSNPAHKYPCLLSHPTPVCQSKQLYLSDFAQFEDFWTIYLTSFDVGVSPRDGGQGPRQAGKPTTLGGREPCHNWN